jgi:hypothetical protein
LVVLINTLFPLMTSFPSSVLLTSLLSINMLTFYLFCFSFIFCCLRIQLISSIYLQCLLAVSYLPLASTQIKKLKCYYYFLLFFFFLWGVFSMSQCETLSLRENT